MNISVNEKLIHWIRKKVESEYSDDICLVVLYGSFINGTANSKSDVDCYFIPKTRRAGAFAQTFIIGDVGYDIFSISWERAQEIASLKSVLLPLIGDAAVLYYGSEADLLRFSRLQSAFTSNLGDPQKTYAAAVERVRQAYSYYARGQRSTSGAEACKNAGLLIMTLADAVALYHHTYYHYGLKRQFADLKNIPGVPSELWQAYQGVIQAQNKTDRFSCCDRMLQEACHHMNISPLTGWEPPPEPPRDGAPQTDYRALASLYEEISSTFQKIYVCCQNGDFILAYLSAVCLQNALDEAHSQLGVERCDLLSAFQYNRLTEFHRSVKAVETNFVDCIIRGGGILRKFHTFEDFALRPV